MLFNTDFNNLTKLSNISAAISNTYKYLIKLRSRLYIDNIFFIYDRARQSQALKYRIIDDQ